MSRCVCGGLLEASLFGESVPGGRRIRGFDASVRWRIYSRLPLRSRPIGARTWAKYIHLKIQEECMRKALWASLFVVMLLSALPIYAQSPNYDVGPVWRVTYFHIKPGQSEAFWKDIRENFKPVYADFKKEGLITDYKMWLNDTTDQDR